MSEETKTSAALRVLHLASGDAWGGAERVIETLLRASISRFEVQAILLNEGRLSALIRDMGVPVQVIAESNRSFLTLLREVRSRLRARDFDVVHCHRYKELLLALLALGFRGGSVVVTIHGLEPRAQLSLREFLRIWGPLSLARYAGVRFAAVSAELAGRLGRWPLRARAVVVPNPMPTVGVGDGMLDLRAKCGWERRRPLVGFIGRLEPVKGPDLFLEVVKQGPVDAAYVMVGEGSMEEELRTRCAEEGLDDRLRFIGLVPDAASLLRQIDLLAMTSRHEGTPMVVLEAAACDVPVVAFGVGGIPDLLEPAPLHWCVAPGDVKNFAAIVRGLLSDRERTRRDTQAWASAIRKSYDQSAVLDLYLDLYLRRPSPSTPRLVACGPTRPPQ